MSHRAYDKRDAVFKFSGMPDNLPFIDTLLQINCGFGHMKSKTKSESPAIHRAPINRFILPADLYTPTGQQQRTMGYEPMADFIVKSTVKSTAFSKKIYQDRG